MNIKFKENVDKQQNKIKDFKDKCNKGDKKRSGISGAGTPMKKNKYVCVTCNIKNLDIFF